MPDPEHLPSNIKAAGIQRYEHLIMEMLRRLAADRLVERLWGRDAALWYPAAETQVRIRARLGWLDRPLDDTQQIEDWARRIRSSDVTDLLYVGVGDAGVIARLWRDLAPPQESLRLVVLDTIEPSVVHATLAAIVWERTAVVLAAEADLTPDMEALAGLVLAARDESARPGALPLIVIAPPDSALLRLVAPRTRSTQLPLPPDIGARFGPLTALGLAPALLLGWDVAPLRSSAVAMRTQCGRHDDLARNPGVWLGTTLAVLAQQGRDKLTLQATPALLPLARWIAAFVSGSLSKHGRGFIVQATSIDPHGDAIYHAQTEGEDQIIVALQLADDNNAALDASCAACEAEGVPLVTLELKDRNAVAGQILAWQIAVATIGVVLGLNPFDEPDIAARTAYLRRRLQYLERRSLPPATSLDRESVDVALRQLRSTITRARCILIAAYLPPSAAVSDALDALRDLLSRRSGAIVVAIDPLCDQSFATQALHAGRPCAILLLTAEATTTVAVPDVAWTLNDLRRERIAADLLAWKLMERPFMHLDLGADPESGLRRCLNLLA